MRLGAAAGEGTVDIQEGRYLEGAGKIAGDVGGLILTAEGGYRAATAPMRAAASEARIQYARERIVETVREASGEGTPGAVVRVPEPPLGGPPAAVPSAPGARVVELHPEVMEALQLAKAEQAAASPAMAARLAERAANDPAALVAMQGGGRLPPTSGTASLSGAGPVAPPVARPPIIVGENMARVQEYANRVGGHAYRPWTNDPFDFDLGMRRNQRWIRDQMRAGREVVDIGPDFARRAATGRSSPFYEMERTRLRGYPHHRKVFQRSGNTGGVPGLDF